MLRHFSSEDGNSMFPRNVNIYRRVYTAPKSRAQSILLMLFIYVICIAVRSSRLSILSDNEGSNYLWNVRRFLHGATFQNTAVFITVFSTIHSTFMNKVFKSFTILKQLMSVVQYSIQGRLEFQDKLRMSWLPERLSASQERHFLKSVDRISVQLLHWVRWAVTAQTSRQLRAIPNPASNQGEDSACPHCRGNTRVQVLLRM